MSRNNQDFWLIFDLAIAEAVGKWIETYPGAVPEAISKIGIFSQAKKFPGARSEAYLRLIKEPIIVSRDVARAARIAFQTLTDHEIREAGEES